MTYCDYGVITITAIVTTLVELLAYAKLSKKELIRLNLKNILIIVFGGIFIMINTYINESISRTFISFAILLFCALLIYKDNLFKTILYMLLCHIFVMLYEIIYSIIVTFLHIFDISLFDTSVIIKTIFSYIVIFSVYLTCSINKLEGIVLKIVNKVSNSIYFISILCIALIFLIAIDFKYCEEFTPSIYFSNLILLLCFIIVIGIAIYNYYTAKKEVEKTEILLSFMSKYEKIIDDNRINRHEMLNNLITLKSIKKKNTKEFESILDELIENYDKKGTSIKNIYKLPEGLKGIFYYKLYGQKKIKVNLNISKKKVNFLKYLNHKEYVILCKIVGILLDNSIEACEVSKDKVLCVDVYDDNKRYVIDICNSCNKVDMKKINNKNYSTKGKNRGLGLYILNKLVSQCNNISVEQKIENDMFISMIFINKIRD